MSMFVCLSVCLFASISLELLVQFHHFYVTYAFSALTLLVGRQEGHPACKKTEWWGAGVVVCLERCADLQMIPLPLTLSCFSTIQIGFFISGTGSAG